MCEGCMLGAYHYYLATNSGKNEMRLVCMSRLREMRCGVAESEPARIFADQGGQG
jgi:hypothetical protein